MKPKPRPMPRRYFARTVPVTLPKAQTLCFRECREATIARSCRSCLLLAGAAIAFVFFTVPVIAETSAEAHLYKPANPHRQSLSPSARSQPGRLVSVGRGGDRQGKAGEQADLRLDRLQHLLLVPRRRADDLFRSRDRRADERVVRQHQGRPRRAARHRPDLHARASSADRARAAGPTMCF